MKLLISTAALALLLSSCALITTPVKVAGSIATTTVKTTGKMVGAGIDLASSGNADENEKEAAVEPTDAE